MAIPKPSPTWAEKCLMVIEFLCENHCIGPQKHMHGERCLPCEIYRIAHVGGATCSHPKWEDEVKKMWGEISKT